MATRRQKQRERKHAAAVILAVCGLGLTGWLAYAFMNPHVPRDDKDLCKPGDPPANVVIMIDKTDRWTPDQGDRLETHIWDQVVKRMRLEEKLWIFTFVDKVATSAPPAFARCRPPDKGNDITQSRRWIEQNFRTSFSEPLRAVIADVKKAEDHPCSPIAEAILDIMTRPEFREPKVPNRLLLFSDMRENSRDFSLILNTKCAPRGGGSPIALQKVFESRRDEVRLDSVVIYQIPVGDRPPTAKVSEDERIRNFWDSLFRRLDVSIVWRRL